MHLAVELDVLDDLAPIRLQRAAVVLEHHAGHPGDQGVRDQRGKPAREPWIFAVAPPTADHVVTLVQLGQQQPDVARIILQIAVEKDEDVAAAVLDAGLQGSGLPEVAAELHELGVGVVFRQRAETFEAPVAAAVVDVEDLVGAAQ